MRLANVHYLVRAVTVVAIMLMPAQSRADTITFIGDSNGAVATQQLSFNAFTNTATLTLINTSPFDAWITAAGFDLFADDFTLNGSSGLNGFSSANVGDFAFTDGDL